MPVAVKVHLPHMTPEMYDALMAKVVHDMEVRHHHRGKVLTHLAYHEGSGMTVIEVCETQEQLDELNEFMLGQLTDSEIEHPTIEQIEVHNLHV